MKTKQASKKRYRAPPDPLITAAHDHFMKDAERSRQESARWIVEVDRSKGKTTTKKEALEQMEPAKLPARLSINNAVNYIKNYYPVKATKKALKEAITKLPYQEKQEFRVQGRSEFSSPAIGYYAYSLESVDKLAVKIVRTQR